MVRKKIFVSLSHLYLHVPLCGPRKYNKKNLQFRVTWQVTQIARGSRVLKDQNKSESRLEFPQVSNGEKKKENKKQKQHNYTKQQQKLQIDIFHGSLH